VDGGKADGQGTTGALRITEVRAHTPRSAGRVVEVMNTSDKPVDLASCTLSIGAKKLQLDPLPARDHVMAPRAARRDHREDFALYAQIPPDAAVVTTSQPLGAQLATSQKLIVRTAGNKSDKADATNAQDDDDTSVERGHDDRFVRSALGATPGEQNGINRRQDRCLLPRPRRRCDRPGRAAPPGRDRRRQATIDAAFFQVNNPS